MPGEKIPRWGYSATDSRIFKLDPGEDLPEGYYHSPADVPATVIAAPTDVAAKEVHAIERRALLDRARELGLETRGTQTNERLREKIEAAEADEASMAAQSAELDRDFSEPPGPVD